MEQFKGTHGKWSLTHSKSKTSWNVIGTKLGGRYKIAQLPYLSDPELSKEWNDKEKREQLCNARLISKAPEMLEMLQLWCMDMEERGKAYGDCYTMTKELIKKTTNT